MTLLRTLFFTALALFAAAPVAAAQTLSGNYELLDADGGQLHPDLYVGQEVTPCSPSFGDSYAINHDTNERSVLASVTFDFIENGVYNWNIGDVSGVLLYVGTNDWGNDIWLSFHPTDPSKDRVMISD